MEQEDKKALIRIKRFLKFAGFYNLGWGIFILRKPSEFYQALNTSAGEAPWYLHLLGASVLLLGIIYVYTAAHPILFRQGILIGLITKSLGPFLSFWLLASTALRQGNFLLHVIFNDLIWILPFALAWRTVRRIKNKDATAA